MSTTESGRPDVTVSWDEAARIVRVVWAPGSICTVDAARRNTEAVDALGKGASPMLVDMRKMRRLDRAARDYFKNNSANLTAVAMLVDSPVTRVIANWFMARSTDARHTPTRIFASEREALVWVDQQRT